METHEEKEYHNPVPAYNDDAAEGGSLPSSLKTGFDFLPKKDIMSIVMKRRLGGCQSYGSESDTSQSPAKKQKTFQSTDVNQSSIYSKIQDKKSVELHGAMPNKYTVAGSVEGFSVSNFKFHNSEGNDSEKTDPIFTIYDCKLDKLKSDGSFKLNLGKQNLCEDERKEQNDDNVCDMNAKTLCSKELPFVEVKPKLYVEKNDKESPSSLEILSENPEDVFNNDDLNDLKSLSEFSSEAVHERSENCSKRSDILNEIPNCETQAEEKQTPTYDKRENTIDAKCEKQFEIETNNKSLQISKSFRDKEDHDKSILDNNYGTDPIPRENKFPDSGKKSCVVTAETQNPVDEVDSLNANTGNQFSSKPSGKKSRKQKMPMRLTTNEMKFDCNSSLKELPSEAESNKSRKPFELKSFTNEQGEYDYIDDDSDEYEFVEAFDKSSHLLEEWDSTVQLHHEIDDQNDNSKESESYLAENFKNEVGHNEQESVNDKTGNTSENELSKDKNEAQKFELPTGLPFNFQDTLLSYSKLFQPHLTNDLAVEKLFEQNQANITENLEVVKKLREIRFNRYRKITVSEKREIADYAKQHSVSSAALHYGVSKSAVSMWTRIDFSDMDDNSGRRKKNFMIGNPKFEELIQRVRDEKSNKFKNLSKEDKVDVSRYAKLVGVREMSRCLNIALGTVSGWMRQFPYSVKQSKKEETGTDASNLSDSLQDSDSLDQQFKAENNSQNGNQEGKEADIGQSTNPLLDQDQLVKIKIEPVDEESNQNGIDDTESKEIKSENPLKDRHFKVERIDDDSGSQQSVGNQNDENVIETGDGKVNKEKVDEIDDLIAVTYEKPDVDKCFEDAKEMIKGSLLENDTFFEKLFRRVVECRADKYKTLKASEKLEVVRFAKRIGVRRIAKILGLATGTLSGWSTKYQAHLGLTSDVFIDLNQSGSSQFSDLDSSLDISQNTSQSDSQSMPLLVSPASSVLDNPERAEVTAVKLILKDRFDYLKGKIEVARKVKFKNITHDEKIEVVKCTKLAGIRPTARVLNMPIGTLSGWITKYTGDLPPVYQEECDRLDGQAIHKPTQSTYSAPGSQAYFYDLMNSQWPGIKHLPSLYTSSGVNTVYENGNYNSNMFNGVGNSSRFGNGLNTENIDTQSENNGVNQSENPTIDDDMYTKTEDNAMYVVRKSNMDLFNSTGSPGYGSMQSGSFVDNNTHFSHNYNTSNTKLADNRDDGFEEEAKSMAAQYLQNFML